MPRIGVVAALEREVRDLAKGCKRVERSHDGRRFTFYEKEAVVLICGGIGVEAARRAAEAVVQLYHPALLYSVGFAGALQAGLRVGDIINPAVVLDVRDGSRSEPVGGSGVLVTFGTVAGLEQKANLARAYQAQAVDMEAAAVAAAAQAHKLEFRAIKVISDEINFELPEMERFIDARGEFRSAKFALFVAIRPWRWARVARLAANSRKASARLSAYLAQSLLSQGAMVEANVS